MTNEATKQDGFVTTLGDLRSRTTDRQRAILDDIWQYLKKENKGIPERPLLHKHKRAIVLQESQDLGGSIIYSGHSDGQLRYNIGLVGVFLTSEGLRLQELIKRYLQYLKTRFESDSHIEQLSSKDFETWEPPPSQSELNELRAIVYMSQGSFASSFSGSNADAWSVRIDNSVIDLPDIEDWDAHIEQQIMRHYRSDMPAGESERMASANLFGDGLLPLQNRIFKSKTIALDLSFIHDQALRKILEDDWSEANRLVTVSAWKSIMILCGGILEGLLLWRLETQPDAGGGNYQDARLSALIKECEDKGLLNKEDGQLTGWTRAYRNVIHPANQRKSDRAVSEPHATLALNLVQIVAANFRLKGSKIPPEVH